MKTFMIYQNSLRSVRNELNEIGDWDAAAEKLTKVNTHLQCSIKGSEGFLAQMFHDYEKVSTIQADDLNGVFQTGNIGPEADIKRFKPMHSISVGDIIRDDRGRFYMVDPCDFHDITLYIWCQS